MFLCYSFDNIFKDQIILNKRCQNLNHSSESVPCLLGIQMRMLINIIQATNYNALMFLF